MQSALPPSGQEYQPPPKNGGGITANLLRYLEARSLLLSLEAQEATQTLLRAAIYFVLGVIISVTAWLLLTTGCVFLVMNKAGWSAMKSFFIIGGAQGILALLLFILAALRIKSTHWFSETINEFKNDRKWLATQADKP